MGNRGRACKRKTKEKEVEPGVVDTTKGKYRGFNDRHLTEKLAEQEKLRDQSVRRCGREASLAGRITQRGESEQASNRREEGG